MQTIRHTRRPATALAVGFAIATLPAVVLVAGCATVLVAWLALLVHGWRTERYIVTPWAYFESVAPPDAARTAPIRPVTAQHTMESPPDASSPADAAGFLDEEC